MVIWHYLKLAKDAGGWLFAIGRPKSIAGSASGCFLEKTQSIQGLVPVCSHLTPYHNREIRMVQDSKAIDAEATIAAVVETYGSVAEFCRRNNVKNRRNFYFVVNEERGLGRKKSRAKEIRELLVNEGLIRFDTND